MSDRGAEYSLPPTLARVAEAFGETAALRLAYHCGATTVYWPAPDRLRPGHPLVEKLGLKLTKGLALLLGPGAVEIPVGPLRTSSNRIEIPAELRGASNAAIARNLGCSARAVQRARARERARNV